ACRSGDREHTGHEAARGRVLLRQQLSPGRDGEPAADATFRTRAAVQRSVVADLAVVIGKCMIDSRPDPSALLGFSEPMLERLHAIVTAGFDEGSIAEAERIAPRQFDAVRLPLVHAWLRSRGDAAAIWARLFCYRDAVTNETATQILGEDLSTALHRAGAL